MDQFIRTLGGQINKKAQNYPRPYFQVILVHPVIILKKYISLYHHEYLCISGMQYIDVFENIYFQ